MAHNQPGLPCPVRRRTLLSLLLLLFLVILWAPWREASSATRPQTPEWATQGLGAVATANNANANLEYYFFFPTRLLQQPQLVHPVLVIVPGLSGRVTKADPATWGKASRENGWIILSPHFKFAERDWETVTSYQYPEAWSGQALLDIMKDFSARSRLKLGPCYLHGVSAGAQFVVRFALWRPAICRAVAAHAGGGTITPQQYIPVRFFISIGREDLSRQGQFDWFLQKAAAVGIPVQSKIYPGGHGLPREQPQDSIRFFEEVR